MCSWRAGTCNIQTACRGSEYMCTPLHSNSVCNCDTTFVILHHKIKQWRCHTELLFWDFSIEHHLFECVTCALVALEVALSLIFTFGSCCCFCCLFQLDKMQVKRLKKQNNPIRDRNTWPSLWKEDQTSTETAQELKDHRQLMLIAEFCHWWGKKCFPTSSQGKKTVGERVTVKVRFDETYGRWRGLTTMEYDSLEWWYQDYCTV